VFRKGPEKRKYFTWRAVNHINLYTYKCRNDKDHRSLDVGGKQMVETYFGKITKQHNRKGSELNFDVSSTPWHTQEAEMAVKHSYPRNILGFQG
jgi:hypothetical protein